MSIMRSYLGVSEREERKERFIVRERRYKRNQRVHLIREEGKRGVQRRTH